VVRQQQHKEEHQVRYNEVKQGYSDPADNDFAQSKKMDTRRPRLTLQHLNKLRKMREVRKLEMEERRELYKKIYQRPPPAM
jgi:hypothetical protein